MLDVDCGHCGRVLIGPRQVVGLTTTPEGIEVAFVCGCGRPGGLLTGRERFARGDAGHAVPAAGAPRE